MSRERARVLAGALSRWFVSEARELPWRDAPGGGRDPYRVLVSEVMLQQTQAARVADRFERFIDRFPSVGALAAAEISDVLAEWSGLGYYRRARLLHRAACEVASRPGAEFPRTASELRRLPGIGAYTAGAIASLAFGERTPAADANVTRVVLRLEGRALVASGREASSLAWDRAAALLEAAPRRPAAIINEALIELGAVVCTPRSPRCGECPVRAHCRAASEGTADEIPARQERQERPRLYFASVLIRDERGRLTVTRRPERGLWGGLYEAPTVERADRPPRPGEIGRALTLPAPPRRLASFPFLTTHRACRFDVYSAGRPAEPPEGWRSLSRERVAELGLSSPQRRILLEIGAALGEPG